MNSPRLDMAIVRGKITASMLYLSCIKSELMLRQPAHPGKVVASEKKDVAVPATNRVLHNQCLLLVFLQRSRK